MSHRRINSVVIHKYRQLYSISDAGLLWHVGKLKVISQCSFLCQPEAGSTTCAWDRDTYSHINCILLYIFLSMN